MKRLLLITFILGAASAMLGCAGGSSYPGYYGGYGYGYPHYGRYGYGSNYGRYGGYYGGGGHWGHYGGWGRR
ncbi:hypothetical protein F6R98_17220 [Candidatus Methylospira mobilis]|uniref:Uncharacterized protein n=1 Tax=Candidatus Methylospira mobilis TaxID=1808979 RepID=A0A5Q0BK22_9GAMM|nr:hypothetical protein [Candidatus Methylospira mobilis]QFY44160.1 hypothetical protein F6R98_17220 [Candidatus Methylospira mobilis]WNV06420.1 hypothetical protein RP726_08450 [Candidatus Methylospira mobilis]